MKLFGRGLGRLFDFSGHRAPRWHGRLCLHVALCARPGPCFASQAAAFSTFVGHATRPGRSQPAAMSLTVHPTPGRSQDEPAYCGLASLAMTLNTLNIDPRRTWKGPWRW